MSSKKLSNNEKNLTQIKFKNFVKNNKSLFSFLLILVLITLAIGFNHIKSNYLDKKPELVYGDDVIEMHFFHLVTCPHCIEQKKFHKVLLERYPNLKIIEYDMASPDSREKYLELAKAQGFKNPENIATPTTFIGNRSNVGFGTPETTGKTLLSMIEDENKRIALSWDNSTMKTTTELRANVGSVK